jgi:hypothetical protein
MPHGESERAAYITGDRTTQMLIARLEGLEDAVGVMLHALDIYGLESEEYADALGAVRDMLP